MSSNVLLIIPVALVILVIMGVVIYSSERRRFWLVINGVIILILAVIFVGVLFLLPALTTAPALPSGPDVADLTPTLMPEIQIVVAGQELPRGTRIDDTQVVLRYWPAMAVPFNSVQNLEDVVGRITRVDIPPESPVLSTMLVDDYDQIARTGRDPSPPVLRGNLTDEEPVTGEINNQNWMEDWYFAGATGDTVTFTIETAAGDLQPFIMLWLLESEEWVEGQREVGDRTMSMTVTLPSSGIYVVSASRARANNGSTAGIYTLSVMPGYVVSP